MSNTHIKNELPILRQTVEFYKIYYQYSAAFPKKDRYALGLKCENYIVDIIELSIQARWLKNSAKENMVNQASLKFDTLKVYIRLLYELKILDEKKYLILQSHIQEIGKMFGGWLNSLKNKNAVN